MTNSSRGASTDLVTIHFASRTPNTPQEIPGSLAPLDEGDYIELGSVASDRRLNGIHISPNDPSPRLYGRINHPRAAASILEDT